MIFLIFLDIYNELFIVCTGIFFNNDFLNSFAVLIVLLLYKFNTHTTNKASKKATTSRSYEGFVNRFSAK